MHNGRLRAPCRRIRSGRSPFGHTRRSGDRHSGDSTAGLGLVRWLARIDCRGWSLACSTWHIDGLPSAEPSERNVYRPPPSSWGHSSPKTGTAGPRHSSPSRFNALSECYRPGDSYIHRRVLRYLLTFCTILIGSEQSRVRHRHPDSLLRAECIRISFIKPFNRVLSQSHRDLLRIHARHSNPRFMKYLVIVHSYFEVSQNSHTNPNPY